MAQQKATRAPAAEIPAAPAALWPADKVERRPIAGLVPYARNARTHSDDQVAELARSIQAFGWTIPVLVDEAGGIIAGHGRILAAQKLGLAEVPVMVAHGWTEEQRRLYVLADNKLALNAGWDDELLRLELVDLRSVGADLSLTGFSPVDLQSLLSPEPATDEKQVGINYQEQYGVIVICTDAAHQEEVYNSLLEAGHDCKVVVT